MSAAAMNYVIHHSASRGSARLVHLIVADVVNDAFGDEFWMSVAKICERTKLSDRAVQHALQELVSDGYLELISENPGQTRHYRFLFAPEAFSGVPPKETTPTPEESSPNTQVTQVEPKLGGKSIAEQLWDALILACKMDGSQVTDSARGALNRAVKSLKKVEATPRDVLRRGVLYRSRFPNAALTPSALVKHWPELVPPLLASNVTELYPDLTEPIELPGAVVQTPEERDRNQARIRELSERFRSERT